MKWRYLNRVAACTMAAFLFVGTCTVMTEVQGSEAAGISVQDTAAISEADQEGMSDTDMPSVLTETFTYLADDEEMHMAYPENIGKDGEVWVLSGVTYDVVPQTYHYTKESEAMWKDEEYVPEPVLERDGLSYILTETETQEWMETGRTRWVSAVKTYLEGQEISEAQDVESMDTVTGEVITGNIPRTELQEDGAGWAAGALSLPAIYLNYGNGSGQYEINGVMVSVAGDTPEFEGYAAQLLQQNTLDPAANRITSIAWDGEAYTNEAGLMCRNAVASGDRLVTRYRAAYQGNIAQPDLPMVRYICHYESEPYAYLVTAEVTYQKEEKSTEPEAGKERMEPEMIAVLSLSSVMCIMLAVLLVFTVKTKARARSWK